MTESALLFENLSFYYEATLALEEVSLSVAPLEFIGIFGPNGGGKTTLLKLILGLLKPQRGKVRLFGEAPEKMRHHIGYVPQTIYFDRSFPISVLDVVMMGSLKHLSWFGTYPKGTRKRALDVLERVELSHKAKAPFGTLSGGELQRALIARAILDNPRLLVLDEPTANIDAEGEKIVYQLLLELNKTMGILMVTHDLQTIVNKVERLLCVQRRVTSLKSTEICEHFALGLYHTPLSTKPHFIGLPS